MFTYIHTYGIIYMEKDINKTSFPMAVDMPIPYSTILSGVQNIDRNEDGHSGVVFPMADKQNKRRLCACPQSL